MSYLDNILGNTQPIAITSADVTLTINQWNNVAFNLTGVLTGNHNLILPFNVNSGSVAVGGLFVVENNTTGAFNVTVLTQAAGSTGVVVPQGIRAFLFSDTVNVWYADDAALHMVSFSGNPNGFLAGTAGAVNKAPSVVWDYTNGVLYFCTTTGNAATAVWTNAVASGAPLPTPQGYLTPVSNTPIITADVVAATTIYYTPYFGTWAAVHNGAAIVAYQFSQLPLVLTSSQAALNLYDIYLVYNSGTPVIGTSPSWVSGSGGSITAGSCARGTGVGGAAIQRASPSGLWVNTASMSLIYNTGSGNNTITVPAGQGILLGSILIDGSAGHVTCQRSYGQNAKWGISNAYNCTTITIQGGDPAASWTMSNIAGFRNSNGNTANEIITMNCLPEQLMDIRFEQFCEYATGTGSTIRIGIGFNSTTVASGTNGSMFVNGSNLTQGTNLLAQYSPLPPLGLNVISALESGSVNGTATAFGTEANMRLSATWRG